MKAKKGSAMPAWALRRWVSGGWQYYVAGRGTGTGYVPATWVPDFNAATHWTSRYAAKQGRAVAGMGSEDCHPHTQSAVVASSVARAQFQGRV